MRIKEQARKRGGNAQDVAPLGRWLDVSSDRKKGGDVGTTKRSKDSIS